MATVGAAGLSPTKYTLDVVTLVNNAGDAFDIRNLMLECKIYESITSNFLLGEIALQDATDFINNAKIVGQESLRIKFRHPGVKNADDTIDRIFRVYKVNGVTRQGQNTTVFLLSFCSPEFLQSKRTRISQAFTGKYSDIINRIAHDHLGISDPASPEGMIDKIQASAVYAWDTETHKAGSSAGMPKNDGPYWESFKSSSDEAGHMIIPNWTVNYAINWLCSKAQVSQSTGAAVFGSYFFYETANGSFRFENLYDMLETKYLDGEEFTFAPAAQPGLGKWNEKMGIGRRILSYNMGITANVLEATVGGMFGSKQTTIDNVKKRYEERIYSYLEDWAQGLSTRPDFTYWDPVNQMYIDKSTGKESGKYPLIWREPDQYHWPPDNSYPIEGKAPPYNNRAMQKQYDKTVSDFPNAHTILTSKNSYVHDAEGIIKSTSERGVDEGAIQTRTATEQLFKYHTMNVLISSRTDISAGQTINLVIPPTRPAAGKLRQSFLHSGEYLITEVMWSLSPRDCRTNLKVLRTTYPSDLDMFVPDLPSGDTG